MPRAIVVPIVVPIVAWSSVVFAVLLTSSVAVADSRTVDRSASSKQRIIGILDIKGPSPEIEAAFEHDLEQQLDTDEYWLAPRAKMRERLRNSTKWTEGCLVGSCLAEARVQTNAELVLLAALTGSGTSFGFVVTLVRTDTGRVLSQESERCDVCTQTEAMNAATLATLRLLSVVPARLPDEAALQGAAIDVAVGSAHQQYTSAQRHKRRLGWTLTVAGLVAAAVGTAVYVLHDDEPDYGLLTALAGGGLALGGVVVLTF